MKGSGVCLNALQQGGPAETGPAPGNGDSPKMEGFSDSFIRWVAHGGLLHHWRQRSWLYQWPWFWSALRSTGLRRSPRSCEKNQRARRRRDGPIISLIPRWKSSVPWSKIDSSDSLGPLVSWKVKYTTTPYSSCNIAALSLHELEDSGRCLHRWGSPVAPIEFRGFLECILGRHLQREQHSVPRAPIRDDVNNRTPPPILSRNLKKTWNGCILTRACSESNRNRGLPSRICHVFHPVTCQDRPLRRTSNDRAGGPPPSRSPRYPQRKGGAHRPQSLSSVPRRRRRSCNQSWWPPLW